MQEIFPLRLYRFLHANRFGLMAAQPLMSALALWVLPPLPGVIVAALAVLPALAMLALVVAQSRVDRVRFKAYGPLTLFGLLFGAVSCALALVALLLQPIVLAHPAVGSAIVLGGIGGVYVMLYVFDAIFSKAFTWAWVQNYTGD